MERKIILSKRASQKLDKLLLYLEFEWSERVKNNFISKFDRALNILKENPRSSPESRKSPGIHQCIVTKQTIIFYKFDRMKIYITTIFDSRQDPIKLKKELK